MKHANLAIFIPHIGCPHRCSFCDQHSISGKENPPSPTEVRQIIENCANQFSERAGLAQIAFFGGSFTCIPRELMTRYLDVAAPFVENGQFSGIRISTRPDGINQEIIALLKEHHVTNIELGAQSMNNTVLRSSNRGHTAKDVEDAARCIHSAGIELGLQMMIGLAGDTKDIAMETARRLAALSPAEMRIYPAVVFPNTQLHNEYLQGRYQPLTIEDALDWTVPIAYMLQEQGIRLLKVGLHQADGAVAGAFHPAFGEMVRTGIFNIHLNSLLPPFPCSADVYLPATQLSAAIGQKRQNILHWQAKGYNLNFIPTKCDDITVTIK